MGNGTKLNGVNVFVIQTVNFKIASIEETQE